MQKILKKNLPNNPKIKDSSRIFFFDEARLGTHSNIGHGWFQKGTRSTVAVKLGFQNFYLYTAASPSSGESFSLILPNVGTECMNIYLQELSKEFPDDKIVLIMDGAGWHKSKSLNIPDNIDIIYLPPYSPELNPVERLWLYIKRSTLRNKIYDKLSDLESAIIDFINILTNDTVSRICKADYLFN